MVKRSKNKNLKRSFIRSNFSLEKLGGFTLIELLVVIAIIGVLVAIMIPSIKDARKQARDARRVTELHNISIALEIYYNKNGHYPIDTSGCIDRAEDNPLISGAGNPEPFFSEAYMSRPPKDPLPSKYCYYYKSNSTGTKYKVAAFMEFDSVKAEEDGGTISNFYEVFNLAESGDQVEISDVELADAMAGYEEKFKCGMDFDYEGESYPTVEIGSQCWMAKNLNVGVQINRSQEQTLGEKYCYLDSSANCDTYGGLYQWDTMMAGSVAEAAQGICPAGWHIPSDNDWKILEEYLGMAENRRESSGVTRMQGWNFECEPMDEGIRLKSGGDTGFNALLGGFLTRYKVNVNNGNVYHTCHTHDGPGCSCSGSFPCPADCTPGIAPCCIEPCGYISWSGQEINKEVGWRQGANFWTSTSSGSKAIKRALGNYQKSRTQCEDIEYPIKRGTNSKSNAYSVRCLKN